MVMKLLVAGLAVVVGAAAVVAGEADDSPGLQLLGVLAAAGGVALAIRALRGRRRARSAPGHPR